jgi:two-component system, CAI-1 autoinducer sensor kinase/phosphatase CqsS
MYHNQFNGQSLLLIDDDIIAYKILRQELADTGLDITHSISGFAGLLQLQQARCDLILMDLNMLLLDGYDTAAKIRAGEVPNCEGIPIVAYTSDTENLVRSRVYEVGMDDLIMKGCGKKQLIETISKYLQRGIKQLVASGEECNTR